MFKINGDRLTPGLIIVMLFLLNLPAGAGAADFVLLYSNDIRGEIEPCG